MKHCRLALLPLLLLGSCETSLDTDEQHGDTDEQPSDTNDPTEPSGELSVSGDASLEDLEDYCAEYARVEVSGSVSLASAEADLSSVDCLGSVSGDLVIEGDDLTTIDLPDLEQVGQDLVLEGLDSLETVNLDALESIGGSLSVVENPYLGIASLEEICDVGTSIVITNNQSLQTLNLAQLEFVNNANASARSVPEGDPGVDISRNPLLEIIDLDMLEGLNAPLMIHDNAALTELRMGTVQTVGGNLQVSNNAQLTSVNFASLGEVLGALIVTTNDLLGFSENDFMSLREVHGDLIIEAMTHGYYGMSFPGLQVVSGSLKMHNLGTQSGASGEVSHTLDLSLLEEVTGEISIDQVSDTTIDLSSLVSTAEDITFANNGALNHITIPEEADWEGNLRLINNGSLESLQSFGRLISIGGMIEIRDNQALQDVTQIREISAIRSDEGTAGNYDECPTASPEVLICGNPSLTLENACVLFSALYTSDAYSGEGYAYTDGASCPETCPTEDFHCTTVCHADNLDNDGDGYSENEGDCDDTDPTIYPGVYDCPDDTE